MAFGPIKQESQWRLRNTEETKKANQKSLEYLHLVKFRVPCPWISLSG